MIRGQVQNTSFYIFFQTAKVEKIRKKKQKNNLPLGKHHNF